MSKQNRKFKPLPFIIEPAREQAFVGHTFKKAEVVMVSEGEVRDLGLLPISLL